MDIYQKLGVTRRHINRLLAGEQNASPKLARRIERQMGIPKETFVFGTSAARRAAWNKAKAMESEP